MRVFKCAQCGQLIYFDNTYCEQCGHPLGFDSETMELHTLVNTQSNQLFEKYNEPGKTVKYCANHAYAVCNWLVPSNSQSGYCLACSLNKIIPDLTLPENRGHWQLLEKAKHRLVYTLMRLNLPLRSKDQDAVTGLAFNFLANANYANRVLTGHEQGLITINIEEADDVARELARKNMGEPYRTLLGHFRHEIGHYYWDVLISRSNALFDFRNMFGDEQLLYDEALQNYYQFGPKQNWLQNHITPYASAHPWEDWAETWAHYMHMLDTLETAWTFGLDIDPKVPNAESVVKATMDVDPFTLENFTDIIHRWLPFTYAMNSINRSMGQRDLYPFVMSDQVIQKLQFIHKLIRGFRSGTNQAS
jgi:hypothetical protein